MPNRQTESIVGDASIAQREERCVVQTFLSMARKNTEREKIPACRRPPKPPGDRVDSGEEEPGTSTSTETTFATEYVEVRGNM